MLRAVFVSILTLCACGNSSEIFDEHSGVLFCHSDTETAMEVYFRGDNFRDGDLILPLTRCAEDENCVAYPVVVDLEGSRNLGANAWCVGNACFERGTGSEVEVDRYTLSDYIMGTSGSVQTKYWHDSEGIVRIIERSGHVYYSC